MKNYKLWKLRILKTGFVFGVNKFDWIWVEFWFFGKLKLDIGYNWQIGPKIFTKTGKDYAKKTCIQNLYERQGYFGV